MYLHLQPVTTYTLETHPCNLFRLFIVRLSMIMTFKKLYFNPKIFMLHVAVKHDLHTVHKLFPCKITFVVKMLRFIFPSHMYVYVYVCVGGGRVSKHPSRRLSTSKPNRHSSSPKPCSSADHTHIPLSFRSF